MYYEQILTEIENFKDFCKQKIAEDKNNLNAPKEIMLRKRVEALGETGRNLADVLQIFDFPMLVAQIRHLEEIGDYSKFEIGDYIIVPQFVFNGTTFYNWRFDLMGIGIYDYRKGETVPGLLFTSHRTCYNAVWPDVNSTVFANLATNIELQVNGVVTLRTTHHYYGQARQATWVDNKCCLLGEQEMGNPQNTYTFNNSHSCALLPLVRRSPVSRIKDSTPNSRNNWWLASRDAYSWSPNNILEVVVIPYYGYICSDDDGPNHYVFNPHPYGVVPSIYL